MISIVVPCYNEENVLSLFYSELIKVLDNQIQDVYELCFVDDGSKDDTLAVIKSISQKDNNVVFISFSRNFGKEAAMYAGLCNVRGDYIVIMDADLQDPPKLLPEMFELVSCGEYDSVATRRVTRTGEPVLRSLFARLFYKIINKITDIDIVDGARDYRMMNRKMMNAIISLSEYNRFSKGLFGWVGFKTKWIEYDNIERAAGETKWNFWKLFKYAIDGIVNFSQVPLDIASGFGILMTLISIIAIIVVVVRKIVYGDPVAGWASTVCIITFVGGIQLFCIGIIGKYIAKTYLETKHRPHYIISETNRKDVDLIG